MTILEKLTKEKLEQIGFVKSNLFGKITEYTPEKNERNEYVGVTVFNQKGDSVTLSFSDSFKEDDFIYSHYYLKSDEYFEIKKDETGKSIIKQYAVMLELNGKKITLYMFDLSIIQKLKDGDFINFIGLPNAKHLYFYGGLTPYRKVSIKGISPVELTFRTSDFKATLSKYSNCVWHPKQEDMVLTIDDKQRIKQNIDKKLKDLEKQREQLDLKTSRLTNDLNTL